MTQVPGTVSPLYTTTYYYEYKHSSGRSQTLLIQEII